MIREPGQRRAMPRIVWALGFVSLFMDVSSEMVHSLLPVFLVSVLGASAVAVGMLEGVAESAVLASRMLSGLLSDRLGRRKGLALAGYGIAALAKPLFPLAHSYPVVFAARLIDRFGKGVRGAPRDALLADSTPAELRGEAYGLRQALDTVGALAGPLLAIPLMLAAGGNFRVVFWVAVLPAFVAVGVLALFVHEPPGPAELGAKPPRLRWQDFHGFGMEFWFAAGTGAVFTVARFSEAFLVLRASDLGLADDYVPLVFVAMNGAYSAMAYPAGRLSDRIGRLRVLAAGALLLVAADVVLATALGTMQLFLGILLWGVHMGLSQGLLSALVADAAPAERRGAAFGLFSLAGGLMTLAASILAGQLWDRIGAPATFYAGALFAAAALAALLVRIRKIGTASSH